MADGPIQRKSFDFAVKVIDVYRRLKDQGDFEIARQWVRCGTSIGANVEEAEAAGTKRDFWAKMCIAAKEARETRYWLRLMQASKMLDLDSGVLLAEVDELIRLLSAIVKTTRENLDRSSPGLSDH